MQAQNTVGILVACIILPLAVAVRPNGPTQPGAPADCTSWYSAKDGDTATGISGTHSIPLAAFMDANPQLSGNPLALWAGYDYCVPQDSKTVSPTGPDPVPQPRALVQIADIGCKPPSQDSSGDTTGSEGNPIPEEPSNAGPTGSIGQEDSPTFQGATGTGGPMQPVNGTGYFPVYSFGTDDVVPHGPTGGRSGEAAEPTYTSTSTRDAPAEESTEVESSDTDESTYDDTEETGSIIAGSSTTSEESTASSHSTSTVQSSTSANSATGSQQSPDSKSTESSESTEDYQSNTGVQSYKDAQTTENSQSSKSSESATASPGSGTDSGGSTMTTSIVAPTKSEGGAQSGTPNSGENGANDLAPSFAAVPRDLKRAETIEARNKVLWTESSGKTYGLAEETIYSDGTSWATTVTVFKFPTRPKTGANSKQPTEVASNSDFQLSL